MEQTGQPLVSVSMIAYKHADFIGEAIRGVLEQQVDFPVELIISDDCSGDPTAAVVESFSTHKNFNWIKYFGHRSNLGMYGNLKFNLDHCKGKYIAFCEGDDYWIDPLKLKKQVGVLECNSDVSLIFSSRKIDNEGVFEDNIIPEHRISLSSFYVNGITFPTQTMIMRNHLPGFMSFLEKNKKSFGFDKLMGYYCLLYGDAYAISDVTAVYRHNGLGAWSRHSEEEKLRLHISESLKFYKIICDNKVDPAITEDKLKFNLFRRVIRNALLAGNKDQVREILKVYKPAAKPVAAAYADYYKNIILRR
ncbi:glycosyltransferase [Chryseobacterium sp. H3056]|uniref:Glycosyltransferase n=1 Tax=Kaistella daneshvariae TaxID=2487074 RepID=A0A3N0WW72_9FLAO|nr:glycosyltransferase [Kaistella daneshvariae]ROI09233.1 glycosyltransferase [Kaistella daneshvariae]